jgi:hypothetical protein
MRKQVTVVAFVILWAGVAMAGELPECCPGTEGRLGDGLVAYYPFEGNANDASGNGNHGTEQGGPSYVGGVCGEAISLDGVDDYLQVSDSASLDVTTRGTLSAWVMIPVGAEYEHRGVFGKLVGSSGGEVSYELWFETTNTGPSGIPGPGIRGAAHDGSLTTSAITQRDIRDGRWHHLAFTWNGGEGIIYVDGHDVTEKTEVGGAGAMVSDFALYMGRYYYTPDGEWYHLRGSIDEARIYNRDLSACEIRKLACAREDQGLVAYYPFNGNAQDASGNGNHGTDQGGPMYVGGVCGQAINLDGADDYVQVPGDPLNLGTSDVTLSAWIRANTLSQEGHGVISKRDGSVASSAGYSLGVNGDNQMAYASIGDGSGTKAFFQSVSVVTDGQWHLITAVCDRDGFGQIYVDGAPDGEPTSISHRSGSMDNGYDLLIGKTVASFGEAGYFLGDIDEVRIYDRALLACEIRQLACAPGNAPPIADAGEEQVVYADADFTADVTLDGSESDDPDGDELSYLWTWTIGGETHQATGVNPQIELPVGEYTVTLVVNDGQEDSEPDQVVITVIAPMKADLWVLPPVINRYSSIPHIMGIVRLPRIWKDQVDAEKMLVLYPGGIEATSQRVSECGRGGTRGTMILALFDKSDLMDAAPANGSVELTVVGGLKSGQYFYGTDTIRVIVPGKPR